MEFSDAVARGKVLSADVVICADGIDGAGACQDQLIGVQPQHVSLGLTEGKPTAHGATCIIESLPDQFKYGRFMNNVIDNLKTQSPQHRFEAFTSGSVVQINVQLTKQEYESLPKSGPLQDSKVIRQRILAALKRYNAASYGLPDHALLYGTVKAFEINLARQPKDGFATVSTIDQEAREPMDFEAIAEEINKKSFGIAVEGIKSSLKVVNLLDSHAVGDIDANVV
ncbi:hypothetical protein HK102_004520 [Quaeritorhiza haematococci]|nr:hypothetical protein HK102_004520 [Quaeritorhiza haematococci]